MLSRYCKKILHYIEFKKTIKVLFYIVFYLNTQSLNMFSLKTLLKTFEFKVSLSCFIKTTLHFCWLKVFFMFKLYFSN